MSSYIDENERLVEENRRLRAAMFKLNLENEALRAAANDLIVGMNNIYHNVCQPCSTCVMGFRKALGDAS